MKTMQRELYLNQRKVLLSIPRTSGLYYFYDRCDNLLYVGVAKILRSRIWKHYVDSQSKGKRNIRVIDKVFDRVYWIEIEEYNYSYAYFREQKQIEKLEPLLNNENGRSVYYSFRDAELIQADIMDPEGFYEIDCYLNSKDFI